MERPARGRGSKIADILARVAGLVLLCFLAGCADQGSALDAKSPLGTPPVTLAPTSTTTSATLAPTPTTLNEVGGPWRFVWSDEFNGASGTLSDPNKWSPRIGGEGWGNGQMDYDTNNQNVYQDWQGNLVLEARRNDPGNVQCWYGPCQYTSAQITTQGHFSFTYGLLQARIKVPQGLGFWSGFWLIGTNCDTVGWPACGEIDVMEILGNAPNRLYATVHGPQVAYSTYQLSQGSFADDFHLYELRWDPDHLYFMLDGMTYYTIDRTSSFPSPDDWVYNHPFSIVFNLPVGGKWPGNPPATATFPQRMYISYVRLYTS